MTTTPPQVEILSKNTASIKIPANAENEAPNTTAAAAGSGGGDGMTAKVVTGSLWTMLGQLLPFLISFFATPFVIRFLGSESYGVLILVGLIPGYFAFADFGMSIASTRFGSEAYAAGSPQKEARVVRTAALIALSAALPAAGGLFLFSAPIVAALKVPEHLLPAAGVALKMTAVAFVFGVLSGIFNTPQLSRLRMDLNTLVNAAGRILISLGTPTVLYFGGGIEAAAAVVLTGTFLMLVGHILISGRLLKQLYEPTIDRRLIRPLLGFGSGLALSAIAAILLINVEKLFLSSLLSVKALAYYSVAFAFASMTTMFSQGMTQSLMPAFSQLLAPEKRAQFDALFERGLRLNIIVLLPAIMFLFVVARPFFTVWAGEEFGRESTPAFYVLLAGLFFNLLAYVPHTVVTALGRTDIFAKVYWIELIFHCLAVYVLISAFGVIGAAAAWSLRVFLDSFVFIWIAKRISGVSFGFLKNYGRLIGACLLLAPPMLFAAFYDNFTLWLAPLTMLSAAAYAFLVWKTLIFADERVWLKRNFSRLLNYA